MSIDYTTYKKACDAITDSDKAMINHYVNMVYMSVDNCFDLAAIAQESDDLKEDLLDQIICAQRLLAKDRENFMVNSVREVISDMFIGREPQEFMTDGHFDYNKFVMIDQAT